MAGNGALDARERGAVLDRLAAERFDVLVIGGGITGAGAALDAASRGLRVALIEARDLASGTSSRSSKLIHGGLRYLEQHDFKLVYEALRERDMLVSKLAPHLVRPVPFLYPLHKKLVERPYGERAWRCTTRWRGRAARCRTTGTCPPAARGSEPQPCRPAALREACSTTTRRSMTPGTR
jgi:glycerol-3-phosphate dehydrogenase